jgi:Ca2+-binding RTX toxin-like protein
MATLTVPGAGSTTITYSGTSNAALAQSIANTLSAILSSGSLTVQSVSGAGGTVPPPSATGVNSLVITSPGVVSVPGGYTYVVDATSGTSPVAVIGAPNFLGGNAPLQVTGTGGAVAVGNGNDVFNMSGAYTVAAGSGNDQYNLAGTGQVFLGGGLSLINIVAGADTIFAGANPGTTGLVGNAGSVFFYAGPATANTADFITGGSGGDTIVGAPNNTVIYSSPLAAGASAPGALLVAGSGSETIYGAPSRSNDLLYGSYSGDANDLIWAGTGNDALVAGSGNQSLVGGSGTDTFYVANTNLLSTIAKTTVTPGKDTLFLESGSNNLALVGYDTLYGAAAGSGAAATVVKAALATGNSAVTLKDGTTITFVGNTSGLNVISS